MLKVFACECGFTRELEHHEYYSTPLECPRCGVTYSHRGQPSKCAEVFEDSIRLLSRGHAEKAAQGFAQAYELWLKHIIDGRDSAWFQAHPKADIRALVHRIRGLFGIPQFTQSQKDLRNMLEHDPNRLATTAEASQYGEHVVETMERNLIELMGAIVWLRGEAGELDAWSPSDSEEHVTALLSYQHHYRTGNIGYVKTARAWWTAYNQGRPDWQQASW